VQGEGGDEGHCTESNELVGDPLLEAVGDSLYGTHVESVRFTFAQHMDVEVRGKTAAGRQFVLTLHRATNVNWIVNEDFHRRPADVAGQLEGTRSEPRGGGWYGLATIDFSLELVSEEQSSEWLGAAEVSIE
jgi:hypothetical protein